MWDGRVGRVETVLADVCERHALVPESCVAYVWGNPEMTVAVKGILHGRGLAAPQIRTEQYWPLASR